jgi:hypothetical protein
MSTGTGRGGAGIGSGCAEWYGDTSIGALIILSGSVNGSCAVDGDEAGAGVGTGCVSSGNSSIGNFIIQTGNVTGSSTAGTNGGAGIGTGCDYGGDSSIGNFIIQNGDVTGNSLSQLYGGAGIGTASATDDTAAIGTFIIEHGNVTGSSVTTGNYGGAGIGTGCGYGGNSGIRNLTIANGTVTGTSVTYGNYGGSEIGTGSAMQGTSRIDDLTIENGNVTGSAESGEYGGSGIGTGAAAGYSAISTIGNLVIRNANATGTTRTQNYGGSGIGTGAAPEDDWGSGDSSITNLRIENGWVLGDVFTTWESSGSAIGTGFSVGRSTSQLANLVLSGNPTLVCISLRASKIWLVDASVFIYTTTVGLFETIPDLTGRVTLTVLYSWTNVGMLEPAFANVPYLSISDLGLPLQDGWRFCISGAGCSEPVFEYILVNSLFTLVPEPGSYSIIAENGVRGFIGPSTVENSIPIASTGSVLGTAYFNLISPTPAASPTLSATPEPTSSPAVTVHTSVFTAGRRSLYSTRRRIRLSFGLVFMSALC